MNMTVSFKKFTLTFLLTGSFLTQMAYGMENLKEKEETPSLSLLAQQCEKEENFKGATTFYKEKIANTYFKNIVRIANRVPEKYYLERCNFFEVMNEIDEESRDKAISYVKKISQLGSSFEEIAIKKENIYSLYLLGILHVYLDIFNKGITKETEGVKYLEKASELGEGAATYLLASVTNYETDPLKRIKLHEKAILQGHGYAAFVLAEFYEKGDSYVEQNHPKAIEFYEKAADLGYLEAALHLIKKYKEGVGVEKNDLKVLYFTKMAADLGDEEAIYQLAQRYEKGILVEKDPLKARELYEQLENMRQFDSNSF